jgi:hypothetical protein
VSFQLVIRVRAYINLAQLCRVYSLPLIQLVIFCLDFLTIKWTLCVYNHTLQLQYNKSEHRNLNATGSAVAPPAQGHDYKPYIYLTLYYKG